MMTYLKIWIALATTAFLAPMAHAQPPELTVIGPLDFENNQAAWTVFGEGARVGITHDADHVHGGLAALEFNYTLARARWSALIIPTAGGLAGTSEIRFWAQSDHDSPFVFVLQEESGVRYLAIFQLPSNTWQEVRLRPDDFWIWNSKDEARDANGKLDLDKVGVALIGDHAQFLIGDAPLQKLFNATPGARTLYVDDFSVARNKIPTPVLPKGVRFIDDFAAPQLAWRNLDKTRIKRVEKSLGRRKIAGVQFEYPIQKRTFGGIARHLVGKRLKSAKALQIMASSRRAATLIVQIKEAGGGKYHATFDLKAGDEPQAIRLDFDDFEVAENSKDNNDRLDVDRATQILILDTSFATRADDGAISENAAWIGDLKATSVAAK